MENTLRLYHGTSEARLHRILREGIMPRTGSQRGNYEGGITSVAGHTYLRATTRFSMLTTHHRA